MNVSVAIDALEEELTVLATYDAEFYNTQIDEMPLNVA